MEPSGNGLAQPLPQANRFRLPYLQPCVKRHQARHQARSFPIFPSGRRPFTALPASAGFGGRLVNRWAASLVPVCGRTRTARGLAFHGSTQNAIDARLITPALALEPIQYVHVKTNAELLFGGRPRRRCFGKESLAERRNIRIVDVGVGHPVKPRQVAFDRFLAHVDLPFSWK